MFVCRLTRGDVDGRDVVVDCPLPAGQLTPAMSATTAVCGVLAGAHTFASGRAVSRVVVVAKQLQLCVL
jgi:hypothetical protein